MTNTNCRSMTGPTYILVPEGRRPLRITVFRRSQRQQIVRIGGAHLPNKMSTIAGFAKVELRPDSRQSAQAYIPAQTVREYWLAVQIFNKAAGGWRQSTIRAKASFKVPALALAFDDFSTEAIVGGHMPSIALAISYSDGLFPSG